MGMDNLHHRRKAKKANDLHRKQAKRASYDRVLIVCEGEKTEPYYFNGLISHYGLNSANVKITGDCGSDPMSIIKCAQQHYDEAKQAKNSFDRVYCVFDQDSHSNYSQAIAKIKSLASKGFDSATSVPCFEYWLLLHFTYIDKPYYKLHNKSASAEVMTDLMKHLPIYKKSLGAIFEHLADKTETAIKNAKRISAVAQKNQTENPSTSVYKLVQYLIQLKPS